MDTSNFLIPYFHAHLLLTLGALILFVLFRMNENTKKFSPVSLLRIGYLTMTVILTLPLLLRLLPSPSILVPRAEIWASPTMRPAMTQLSSHESISVHLDFLSGPSTVSANTLKQWIFLGLVLGFLLIFTRVTLDFGKLLRIVRSSHQIRRIGRVRILVHDSILVPFSFWIPRRAYVVIPSATLANASEYRMALLHEIQHHRQRDTRWVHMLQILRVFFFPNPLIHVLEREFAKLQEFACDEALVDRKCVSPQAYGRYLFEVAKTALSPRCALVGATGLAARTSGHHLKGRIEAMLNRNKTKFGRLVTAALGATILIAIVGTAFATQDVIRDRRISMTEATEMAEVAKKGGTFPVVINEQVLEELNRYLGTPDGREFIRKSLVRMENHRELVEGKVREYRHPEELIAIPLIESGYENLAPQRNPVRAAGLWQFIASTARHFNLRVDARVDERLNVELETDAAMRYLGANYLRFQDWALAALAYNVGERRIQRGIEATGSRDPWVLIKNGYGNDYHYLPKLIAAILIIRNPDVLN